MLYPEQLKLGALLTSAEGGASAALLANAEEGASVALRAAAAICTRACRASPRDRRPLGKSAESERRGLVWESHLRRRAAA